MEEAIAFALIVTVIVCIVGLIGAGLVVALALALVLAFCAGIGFGLYWTFMAVIRMVDGVIEESHQQSLRLQQEQDARALFLQEEAKRHELHRREIEAELKHHAAEQRRLEAIAARETAEAAARDRLEAERDTVAQTILSQGSRSLAKRLSARQINRIVDDLGRIVSHPGKFLNVIVVVGQSGVAMEWKVHIASSVVPQVIAYRDDQEMFRVWAFSGRHSAVVAPGRHVLTFRVIQQGRPQSESDLAFEVFVLVQSRPDSIDAFKSAVKATTDDFIARSEAVDEARGRVEEVLVNQGNDVQQIAFGLSKLEARLSDLQGTQQEG